ncbi:hypothetical protein RRG08_062375 [Elysia crispata]|uniref:Uncharacterized protein n=1 Tax=Elysia crispata TaxID=231223 RepID=A0AAE0YGT6_9GAST|nr:hypothetical protein RRG08_062375 [Elysia crispata]
MDHLKFTSQIGGSNGPGLWSFTVIHGLFEVHIPDWRIEWSGFRSLTVIHGPFEVHISDWRLEWSWLVGLSLLSIDYLKFTSQIGGSNGLALGSTSENGSYDGLDYSSFTVVHGPLEVHIRDCSGSLACSSFTLVHAPLVHISEWRLRWSGLSLFHSCPWSIRLSYPRHRLDIFARNLRTQPWQEIQG